jgi:hypothetical protein
MQHKEAEVGLHEQKLIKTWLSERNKIIYKNQWDIEKQQAVRTGSLGH